MTARTRAKNTKKKKHRLPDREVVKFPEVKGKKLEGVEFSNSTDYYGIHLRFEDQTDLTFQVEPGFTLFTLYSDWKTRDGRRLKEWPPIRSRISQETM